MDEFIINIQGNNSLEEILLMINGVEGAGAVFLKSSLAYHENEITNLATFQDLPPGQRPKRLTLTKGGATPSDGMTQVWAGIMLIGGRNVAVTAFR